MWPRPLVACGATPSEPQDGQIGAGGWKKRWQVLQRWIISRPDSPPCQKADESQVIWGSFRGMNAGYVGLAVC